MDEQEDKVAAFKGFSCTGPLFVAFTASISPFENHILIFSFEGPFLPFSTHRDLGKGLILLSDSMARQVGKASAIKSICSIFLSHSDLFREGT